jgi:hypothetical protein
MLSAYYPHNIERLEKQARVVPLCIKPHPASTYIHIEPLHQELGGQIARNRTGKDEEIKSSSP